MLEPLVVKATRAVPRREGRSNPSDLSNPLGGGIISNKIILPVREFRTSVLMNSPLGKFIYSNGEILYEYPKEILDRNAHIHHNHMVSGILHHMDYI